MRNSYPQGKEHFFDKHYIFTFFICVDVMRTMMTESFFFPNLFLFILYTNYRHKYQQSIIFCIKYLKFKNACKTSISSTKELCAWITITTNNAEHKY